jgi:hypothetical protein
MFDKDWLKGLAFCIILSIVNALIIVGALDKTS